MVPSWCQRQTAADGMVALPALVVNASSVQSVAGAGPCEICTSASASTSAS